MSGEGWIKVIDSLLPYTEFFSLIGGEPTLHPDFPMVIDYLNTVGANYTTVTNGTAPHDYYKHLIEDIGIKSLGVSMDELYSDDSNKKPETIKSVLGKNLIRFIRNETIYDGELIISSIIKDTMSCGAILDFAAIHECKVALSLLQSSTDPNQLNSNNPKNEPFNEKDIIDVLKWLVHSKPEEVLDPQEYYLAMLYRIMLKKGKWHCSKGLTPAVNCNGDLWGCFDFMGDVNPVIGRPRINLLNEDFEPEKHFEAVMYSCVYCPGCLWNCPFVSELIADGIVEMKFS